MNKVNYKLVGVVLVLAGLAIGLLLQQKTQILGTAPEGEGNFGTSTVNTINWASATTYNVLKVGRGQLSAITVGSTSPATVGYPSMKCYDSSVSTTTASSTLLSVGSAAVGGTYTVDMVFNAGLICESPAGFIGGYTITWK